MRIFLQFAPEQSNVHRSRLQYAFSLFCAIYGHQPVFRSGESQLADVWISYLSSCTQSSLRPVLQLGNLYQPRSPYEAAPPPKEFGLDDERTVLFCSSLSGQEPDWLGEIFEWVSCADEYSIRTRDSIGCIPFADSYVGRHKLNVRLPYAAIAMHFLQQALCEAVRQCSSEPASPVPSGRHFVIGTHDVDFLPLSYLGCIYRLAKNALVSLLRYRSPVLALDQAEKALLTMVGGGNQLDQLPGLVEGQIGRGFNASYFFLTQRRHRRDGNYRIDQPRVLTLMRALERQGMEIGIHGSYSSLDEPDGLVPEFARLHELGFRPEGGRQHWLRFTLDRLIPAMESVGASYDASLGWNETTGFRGGACFAFPPYNFEHERASTFLEIPLVAMDENLMVEKVPKKNWYDHVAELLSVSRRFGWGGISMLWHPTAFGGGQLPPGIGEVFWRLVDQREEWKDTWLCAADFVQLVRQRYVEVGLFPAL